MGLPGSLLLLDRDDPHERSGRIPAEAERFLPPRCVHCGRKTRHGHDAVRNHRHLRLRARLRRSAAGVHTRALRREDTKREEVRMRGAHGVPLHVRLRGAVCV